MHLLPHIWRQLRYKYCGYNIQILETDGYVVVAVYCTKIDEKNKVEKNGNCDALQLEASRRPQSLWTLITRSRMHHREEFVESLVTQLCIARFCGDLVH